MAKSNASKPKRVRRGKRIVETTGLVEYIADQWWRDPDESRGRDDSRGGRRGGKNRVPDETDRSQRPEVEETSQDEVESAAPPKKKRRVRRRVKGTKSVTPSAPAPESTSVEVEAVGRSERTKVSGSADETAAPKKKRRRRRSKSAARKQESAEPVSVEPESNEVELEPEVVTETEPPVSKRPSRRRGRRGQAAKSQPEQRAVSPKETPPAKPREKTPVRKRKEAAPAPIAEVKSTEKPAPKRKESRAKESRAKESRQPVSEAKEPKSQKPRAKKTTTEWVELPPAVQKKPKPQAKPAERARKPRKAVAESKAERPREEPVSPKKKRPALGTKKRGQLKTKFAELGLSATMLESLEAADYLEPTPVQAGIIARAIEGEDLMGQARTGTGKTAAFAIPILEILGELESGHAPGALILVPTRELAVQVRDEFAKLAKGSRIQIVAVYGGKPIRQQIDKLNRGPDVVVGTPGRVIDLIGRGSLILGELELVVLDEADRMLDIGFRPDIEKILRRCPKERQTLLLSATLPDSVLRLARRYMQEPDVLDFSSKDVAVETIEQFYFSVDRERKFDLLLKLLERENPTQAIIFCRTKRGTEKIYQRLSRKSNLSSGCIHGDLQQSARDRMMAQFRAAKVRLLVATDVVGRGIDISGISHIINFDIPEFCDDYIHRVGRTGRMGREGVAYSLVSPEEGPQLTRIEMRINRLLTRDEIADFDATAKSREERPEFEAKPVFGRPKRKLRRAL